MHFELPNTVILSEGLPPASKGWADVIYIAAEEVEVGTVLIRPDLDTWFIRCGNGWAKYPD